ncbi:hypothetical protein U9M48_028726 [Paspalum notatum var. saurae]|uniref:Uncharacterized protein n=1 Tax=Paspalum notatum var. saurae TaxID=547442 RepID=A0AAQ3TZY3_PASNO
MSTTSFILLPIFHQVIDRLIRGLMLSPVIKVLENFVQYCKAQICHHQISSWLMNLMHQICLWIHLKSMLVCCPFVAKPRRCFQLELKFLEYVPVVALLGLFFYCVSKHQFFWTFSHAFLIFNALRHIYLVDNPVVLPQKADHTVVVFNHLLPIPLKLRHC